MMKSIGLLTVLFTAIAAAYLPDGDHCSSGKCAQGEASTGKCASCAATEASWSVTKIGTEGKCAGGKCGSCSSDDKAACSSCPATKNTSQDGGKCCAGGKCESKEAGKCCADGKCESKDSGKCCADGKCAKCSAGDKSACSSCPATTNTSKDAAEKCASCPHGDKSACASCPATKETSKGATSKDSGKTCAKGKCPASGGVDCKDCPITTAMKQLPQMTYAVGAEKTCCPKTAAKLAEKSGADVQYVVGDKSFEKEAEAKQALADATEQFVAAFAKPKVCSKSGNITVAGQKACCESTAAEMAKVASAAMEKVHMSYVVGEKSCNCPVEAEKLAKDTGEVKLFVVGEEKTACNVTARLNLARAKCKAAVVALMQASSATTKETSKEASDKASKDS